MSLLSRYVKKTALLSITTSVLGLWLLQTLFAYLAELDNLSDGYQLVDALRYILYMSPYFLQQFIPTGALLGAVVGLGLLANNSEIVVMRASGVSSVKIVSWVMQPALIFVLVALLINQFVQKPFVIRRIMARHQSQAIGRYSQLMMSKALA